MKIVCPTCSRSLEGSAEELRWRPFCSKRCKLIDLGKWLDGAYRVSEPISEAELDEGAPAFSSEGGGATSKNGPKN